jgi:hypothetical protein
MEHSEGRPSIKDTARQSVINIVRDKMLTRLKQKGPGCFVSSHEALGIITEEYHELIEAVQANDPDAVDEEMVDIAVAAMLAIMSRMSGGMDW